MQDEAVDLLDAEQLAGALDLGRDVLGGVARRVAALGQEADVVAAAGSLQPAADGSLRGAVAVVHATSISRPPRSTKPSSSGSTGKRVP